MLTHSATLTLMLALASPAAAQLVVADAQGKIVGDLLSWESNTGATVAIQTPLGSAGPIEVSTQGFTSSGTLYSIVWSEPGCTGMVYLSPPNPDLMVPGAIAGNAIYAATSLTASVVPFQSASDGITCSDVSSSYLLVPAAAIASTSEVSGASYGT